MKNKPQWGQTVAKDGFSDGLLGQQKNIFCKLSHKSSTRAKSGQICSQGGFLVHSQKATGLYVPTSLPPLITKHEWRSGRTLAYGAKGRRFESGLVRESFK